MKILKNILLIVGKFSKSKLIWNLEMVLNYIKLGNWKQTNGFYTDSRLPNRNTVFDAVINNIKGEKVLYLEFGVKYGTSMK